MPTSHCTLVGLRGQAPAAGSDNLSPERHELLPLSTGEKGLLLPCHPLRLRQAPFAGERPCHHQIHLSATSIAYWRQSDTQCPQANREAPGATTARSPAAVSDIATDVRAPRREAGCDPLRRGHSGRCKAYGQAPGRCTAEHETNPDNAQESRGAATRQGVPGPVVPPFPVVSVSLLP